MADNPPKKPGHSLADHQYGTDTAQNVRPAPAWCSHAPFTSGMPAPSSASSSAAERRKQRSKRCECGGFWLAAQVRIGSVRW